jgi:GMP synthase (glutamine-hydrolysing)
VYCEIHPCDVSDDFVREFGARGVILSRQPCMSVPKTTRRVRRKRCSSWACRCWASATACRPWPRSWAARSRPAHTREFGYAEVRARGHTRLLEGIEDFTHAPKATACCKVWMSHGDKVTALPPGFKLMASTPTLPDRRHGR